MRPLRHLPAMRRPARPRMARTMEVFCPFSKQFALGCSKNRNGNAPVSPTTALPRKRAQPRARAATETDPTAMTIVTTALPDVLADITAKSALTAANGFIDAVEFPHTFSSLLQSGCLLKPHRPLALLLPHGCELSREQRSIVERIAVTGESMFVMGSAGTGKSVLLEAVAHHVMRQRRRSKAPAPKRSVALTAVSLSAAQQLGVPTLHQMLDIDSKGNMRGGDLLAHIDLLLIDDANMMSVDVFEALDSAARRARFVSDEPFGGIQVVMCGDFLQLTASSVLHLYQLDVFRGYFQTVGLTRDFRRIQRDSEKSDTSPSQSASASVFLRALDGLRRGELPSDIRSIVSVVPKLSDVGQSDLSKSLTLFPRRQDADVHNNMCALGTKGPQVLLKSFTTDPLLAGHWTPTIHITFLVTVDAARFASQLAFHIMSHLADGFDPTHLCVFNVTPTTLAVRYLLSADNGRTIKLTPRALRRRQRTMTVRLDHIVRQTLHGYESDISSVSYDHHPTCTANILSRLQKQLDVECPAADDNVVVKRGSRVILTRTLLGTGLVRGHTGVVEGFAVASQFMPHTSKTLQQSLCEMLLPLDTVIPLVRFDPSPSNRTTPTRDTPLTAVLPTRISVGGPRTHFFTLHRMSFPLALGYGLAIHNVQGLTMQCPVVVDCTAPYPCEHLGYVACSRVVSPQHLTVAGDINNLLAVNDESRIFCDLQMCK